MSDVGRITSTDVSQKTSLTDIDLFLFSSQWVNNQNYKGNHLNSEGELLKTQGYQYFSPMNTLVQTIVVAGLG